MKRRDPVTVEDVATVDGPFHIFLVHMMADVDEDARFPKLPLSVKTAAAVQDELNRHPELEFQTGGYAAAWNMNEIVLVMKDPNWRRPEPAPGIRFTDADPRRPMPDPRTRELIQRQAEAWRNVRRRERT